MSSLKSRIAAALAEAGLSPLHRLGQNFMIDPAALDALVGELRLSPGVRVAEIGPGTGVLTERLLDAGAEVLAIELDRGLAGLLERTLAGRGLRLVHGDALETKSKLHPALVEFAGVALPPWRLGANLPYDIAIPALLNAATLADGARAPELAVVTVQWEAAARLCSRPGSDAWGASAAVLQAAGEAAIVRRLSPEAFFPRPKVDSAILRWRPHARCALGADFTAWVRRVFAARRKVVVRALRDTGCDRADAEAACRACGIDGGRRLEALDAPELVALHAAVSATAAAKDPAP